MSKIEWKKWINVVGSLLLVYALIFSQSAWAGQNQKAMDKAGSTEKASVQQTTEKQSAAATTAKASAKEAQGEASESAVTKEKPPGDGKHEGIKVHGHWTIEVRNPDGTVVTHREFENSLDTTGAITLAALISRSRSAGFWEIQLNYSVSSPAPCTASNGSASACYIVEPGFGGAADSATFPTLSVALGSGATAGEVILSGSAVAANAGGTIVIVNTQLLECINTNAPSAPCNVANSLIIPGQSFFGFTGAVLASPVVVQNGQIIAVTVNISFS